MPPKNIEPLQEPVHLRSSESGLVRNDPVKHFTTPRPFELVTKRGIVAVSLLVAVVIYGFIFLNAQQGREDWKETHDKVAVESWAEPQKVTIIDAYILENNYWGPTYSVTMELEDGTVMNPRAIKGEDMATGDDLLFWDCVPTHDWAPCETGEGMLTSAASQAHPWDGKFVSYNTGDVLVWTLGNIITWLFPFVIVTIAGLYWSLRQNLASQWMADNMPADPARDGELADQVH